MRFRIWRKKRRRRRRRARCSRSGLPAAPAPPPRQRLYDLDRFGQITDPLPAPLPMPAGSPDAAAQAIAQRVLDGGPDALAALVTGLQSVRASPSAVRRVNSSPDPQSLGLGQIVDAWEVRTMLASALPERTVSLALSDVAGDRPNAGPRIEERAGRAVARARSARAGASGRPRPAGSGRGSSSSSDAVPKGWPSPLVTQSDLAKIRLNGLQVSLILQRLSLDFLKRSRDPAQKSASNTPSRGWSFVVPLLCRHAPLHARRQGTHHHGRRRGGRRLGRRRVRRRRRLHLRRRAGDHGRCWMERRRTRPSLLAGYANIFLAYAKFIATVRGPRGQRRRWTSRWFAPRT